MPAKTPAQRRLFGAALAAKRGAEPVSKKVADIAAKTSEKAHKIPKCAPGVAGLVVERAQVEVG